MADTDPFATIGEMAPSLMQILKLLGADQAIEDYIRRTTRASSKSPLYDPFRNRTSNMPVFEQHDYDNYYDKLNNFDYSLRPTKSATLMGNALSFFNQSVLQNSGSAKAAYEAAIMQAGGGVSYAAMQLGKDMNINAFSRRASSVEDVDAFFRFAMYKKHASMTIGDSGILAGEYARSNMGSLSGVAGMRDTINGAGGLRFNDDGTFSATKGNDSTVKEILEAKNNTVKNFKEMQNAISSWQQVLNTDVLPTIQALSELVGGNVLATFKGSGTALGSMAKQIQHTGSITGRGQGYVLGAQQSASDMLAKIGGDRAASLQVGLLAASRSAFTSTYRLDEAAWEQKNLAMTVGNADSKTAHAMGGLYTYAAVNGIANPAAFESLLSSEAGMAAFGTNGQLDINKLTNLNRISSFGQSQGWGSIDKTTYDLYSRSNVSKDYIMLSSLPTGMAAAAQISETRGKILSYLPENMRAAFKSGTAQDDLFTALASGDLSEIARTFRGTATGKNMSDKDIKDIYSKVTGLINMDTEKLKGQLGLSGSAYANMTSQELLQKLISNPKAIMEEAAARTRIDERLGDRGSGFKGIGEILNIDSIMDDKATIGALGVKLFGVRGEADTFRDFMGVDNANLRGQLDANLAAAYGRVTAYEKTNDVSINPDDIIKNIRKDAKIAVSTKDTKLRTQAQRAYEDMTGFQVNIDDKGGVTLTSIPVDRSADGRKNALDPYIAKSSPDAARKQLINNANGLKDSDGNLINVTEKTFGSLNYMDEQRAAALSAVSTKAQAENEEIDELIGTRNGLAAKLEEAKTEEERKAIEKQLTPIKTNISDKMDRKKALKALRHEIQDSPQYGPDLQKRVVSKVGEDTMAEAEKVAGINQMDAIPNLLAELIKALQQLIPAMNNMRIL